MTNIDIKAFLWQSFKEGEELKIKPVSDEGFPGFIFVSDNTYTAIGIEPGLEIKGEELEFVWQYDSHGVWKNCHHWYLHYQAIPVSTRQIIRYKSTIQGKQPDGKGEEKQIKQIKNNMEKFKIVSRVKKGQTVYTLNEGKIIKGIVIGYQSGIVSDRNYIGRTEPEVEIKSGVDYYCWAKEVDCYNSERSLIYAIKST